MKSSYYLQKIAVYNSINTWTSTSGCINEIKPRIGDHEAPASSVPSRLPPRLLHVQRFRLTGRVQVLRRNAPGHRLRLLRQVLPGRQGERRRGQARPRRHRREDRPRSGQGHRQAHRRPAGLREGQEAAGVPALVLRAVLGRRVRDRRRGGRHRLGHGRRPGRRRHGAQRGAGCPQDLRGRVQGATRAVAAGRGGRRVRQGGVRRAECNGGAVAVLLIDDMKQGRKLGGLQSFGSSLSGFVIRSLE